MDKEKDQPSQKASLSERIYSRFKQDNKESVSPSASSTDLPIDSSFDVPPLSPIRLCGYSENTKSRLLSPDLLEDIRQLLPPRFQLYDEWNLAYSLEQHGSSLHTLYERVKPVSRSQRRQPGYVLAIRDSQQNVFGAYVNESFRPTEQRRYIGNGECFLWKTETPTAPVVQSPNGTPNRTPDGSSPALTLHNSSRFRAFPYTGENDFMIFCTQSFLSIGGGDGHYGLWIDDNLMHGITQRTTTFGNDPLTTTKFSILGVEVWRIGA